MDDKTMLEMAARAAGLSAEWRATATGMVTGPWVGEFHRQHWNPLTDDGDALRLAVRLFIDTQFIDNGGGQAVYCYAGAIVTAEPVGPHNDHGTATRRAIVRAAAEIGKAMGRGE